MADINSSVNEYLESLPEPIFTRLFQSPATCLSIFRLLPKLAKTLVISMLYRDDPLPLDYVDSLVNNQSQRLQGEAIKNSKDYTLLRKGIKH